MGNVPVGRGTAVVFHNSIPHCFKSIHNTTDQFQRHLFLSVFLVDPSQPLPISPNIPFLRRVLSRRNIGERDVQNEIFGFLEGSAHPSMLYRKLVRDKTRSCMSKDRPHWYTIIHGNCSNVKYHKDSRSINYGSPMRNPQNYSNYQGLEHSDCRSSALGSEC